METPRDLFLDQHAAVHTAAVGGNKMSVAERTFGGLTDAQMRMRPREDLNSLAWLMWHIARAEDVFVNGVVSGRPQLWNDGWAKKLNVSRSDFGIGMSSGEVWDFTNAVDVAALREYRDAVGLATRDVIGGLTAADWNGMTSSECVDRTAAAGAFGARTDALSKAFVGRPKASLLSAIALFHAAGHMGEANTVRTAGGFGLGV